MFFTKLKRVFKSGFINFWRNWFLSFSSILVLSISLLVFGGLIFFNTLNQNFINSVKDKVDINIYFTNGASEDEIINLKQNLEKMGEVASVEYVSKEKAFADFKEKHKDNALIVQGLDEVGYNPLPASLNVKANSPSQYEAIAKYLESGKTALSKSGNSIIESTDYARNKIIIDRLGRIVPLIEKTLLVLSIILVLISIIVTFNTIRLIIFSSRDEIAVMKLVGATNMYVRGPFVVGGVMCGVAAAILALIVLAFLSYYIDLIFIKFLNASPEDITTVKYILFKYYVANFGQILSIILGSGIVLGAVSSYLAVRRYLNV